MGRRAVIRWLLCLSIVSNAVRSDPAAWHVQGDNGASLWLLGSIHVLRESDHPLPGVVDRLYANADTLVMELDLDDLDIAATQAAFVGASMLPPDRTLADVVDEDTYALTASTAQELGLPIELLQRFEPWFVALSLLELGMARLGFDSAHGVEQYLLGKARRDGKEITGLESLELQISIFDRLAEQDQEALLVQTLQELASVEDAIDELLPAWRDGRLDELAEELLSDFSDVPTLYDALVRQRNLDWAEALAGLLAGGGRHLVIVGALHLVGTDSLVGLLEERGFMVERIGP